MRNPRRGQLPTPSKICFRDRDVRERFQYSGYADESERNHEFSGESARNVRYCETLRRYSAYDAWSLAVFAAAETPRCATIILPGMKTAAFVGLGIMGEPMAGHLLAGGYALRVYSRTKAKAAALLDAGAVWCASAADAATDTPIVCINVTDTPDVEQVLFGENGAAATLQPGSIVLDFSTISPPATQAFAARLAERGVSLLDAPVTGGDIGARNATLTIMVGGDRAAFDRVAPMLALLGKRIVHVGPSGSGQLLKACNQVLCALNMIGVCEALTLAKQAGLDQSVALETLSAGAGGSWAWTNLGPKIVAGDLKPAFMIKLIQKDLRIVQAAAQELGTPLPGTALAQQLFRVVEALAGGENLGTQGMIRAYQRLSGGE
ncbi:MAG: NAD(P)-dependent oxidoreductase [Phycisphaerae bacterium]